jgi:hypothetical protein
MAFDKGHALLIGVGTYANAPQLNVPVTTADAEQVAMVLADSRFCGYPAGQVTLLRDGQATRAGILQALENLAARAAKDDTVLLFYSGHGHYGEDGTYYLTTTDMQLTTNGKVADKTAVREDELLAALQRIQAERMLLIFNACHSGEISPTLAAEEKPFTGATLPAPTAAALLSTGSGRVIITACRDKQFAYLGDGNNTIFVQALVDGLRGQGVSSQRGFISAFDLYTRLYFAVTETVQNTIPEATRLRYSPTQEPELTVLKGVGPFAVALYQGASATLGEFSAPSEPGAGTATRAVEPAESRAAFEKLSNIHIEHIDQSGQSGGISFGAGNTIGSIGDIVAGDKIGGDKVMGDKRTIHTGGGDYSEGNIDKRSSTFVQGDQHNVSGTFSGSNLNIGSILSNVSQSVASAAQAEQSEKEQLEQLVTQLRSALQQAPADRQAEAEAVAIFAQQLMDNATNPKANKAVVQLTAATLKQAAESIAAVLPAVLTISTQIVNVVGRLVP